MKKEQPKRECCKRVARVHVKVMADQITAHHTRETVLVLRLTVLQDAAREALKLIDAARTDRWTPADDITLAEIRSLV